MVALHPEQVPSLLYQVTENKSFDQNDDKDIDDLVPDIAELNMCPDTVPDNTAVLPYDNELELSI